MYFGDNSDDVRNSSSGLLEPATIHTPGQLEMDKTYDWHRDESDVITPHRVKLWPDGESEPLDWDFERYETDDPASGSALLIAHHADVTCVSVQANPIATQR